MAAPALIGLGSLFLAGSEIKRRRALGAHRTIHSARELNSASLAEPTDHTAHSQGSGGSPASTPRGSETSAQTNAKSARSETALRLEPGSTVCFLSADGKLMGLRPSPASTRELNLVPVTFSSVQAGSTRRMQHFPADSVFLVNNQGDDITFASVSATGQLLHPGKDKHAPLRVGGHSAPKATTWKVSGTALVSAATDVELGLTPKLLHTFSIDEMRDMERHIHRSERELSAKVRDLRDALRRAEVDARDAQRAAQQRQQDLEAESLTAQSQLDETQQRLIVAEADNRRKAALLRQLEGRLADISMGGDVEGEGSGLSDIVRHWQAQVAAAEERARQAASEHAKETAALRAAHASEIAAMKEEHAASLEGVEATAGAGRHAARMGDSDPVVAALRSRVRTLQDKVQQQSGVIVELMEEVERLAEVEYAMGRIQHSLETATPREPAATPRSGSMRVRTVPRNPWLDLETPHERLVRESSMISGSSQPNTARGEGTARPRSGGHDMRPSRHSVGAPQYPPAGGPSGSQTARAHLESAPCEGSGNASSRSFSGRRASLPVDASGTLRPRSGGSHSGSSTGRTSSAAQVGAEALARSRSGGRPASARTATTTSAARRGSLQRQDSLGLHFPSEMGPRLSAVLSQQTVDDALSGPTNDSNTRMSLGRAGSGIRRANSGALQDTTNSPPPPRGGRHVHERELKASDRGVENRSQESSRSFGDHPPSAFLGMGKADEEVHLATKREMSVLEENSRMLGFQHSSTSHSGEVERRSGSSLGRSASSPPNHHNGVAFGSTTHQRPRSGGSGSAAAAAPTGRSSSEHAHKERSGKARPSALDLSCVSRPFDDSSENRRTARRRSSGTGGDSHRQQPRNKADRSSDRRKERSSSRAHSNSSRSKKSEKGAAMELKREPSAQLETQLPLTTSDLERAPSLRRQASLSGAATLSPHHGVAPIRSRVADRPSSPTSSQVSASTGNLRRVPSLPSSAAPPAILSEPLHPESLPTAPEPRENDRERTMHFDSAVKGADDAAESKLNSLQGESYAGGVAGHSEDALAQLSLVDLTTDDANQPPSSAAPDGLPLVPEPTLESAAAATGPTDGTGGHEVSFGVACAGDLGQPAANRGTFTLGTSSASGPAVTSRRPPTGNLRPPASPAKLDLRQSIESQGLKAAAARSSSGRDGHGRKASDALGHDLTSEASEMADSMPRAPHDRAPVPQLPARGSEDGRQHGILAEESSRSVRDIATKYDSPVKQEPENTVSPRASNEGRRSRFAKRALGVFRMSRSVSADGGLIGTGSGALADVESGSSEWPNLEQGRLHASIERREQLGDCVRYVNGVPLLNRRLSMGDERVDDAGRISWDDLMLQGPDNNDELQASEAAKQGKTLPRPSFLERMAIQSVDLKPW